MKVVNVLILLLLVPMLYAGECRKAIGAAGESATFAAPPAKPGASFRYSTNGLLVQFVSTSTSASSWSWDFGDLSGGSTEESPLHPYSRSGSFIVILDVCSDSALCDVASAVVVVSGSS